MIRYRACHQSSGEGKMWYKLKASEKASWRQRWLWWVLIDVTVLESLARVFQAEKNLCKGRERGFGDCDIIKAVVANFAGAMHRETRWGLKEGEPELRIGRVSWFINGMRWGTLMVFNRVGLDLHGFSCISEKFHFIILLLFPFVDSAIIVNKIFLNLILVNHI